MTRRTAWLVAVVTLGALATGACSGDSAHDTYVKQATKACDDSFHEIGVALSLITATSTDEQAASFLTTQFVPLYRKRVAALRALTPAKGDAATVAAMLDDADAVLTGISADPGAYVRVDPFAELNPRWDSFGVPACGSRADTSGTLPNGGESGSSSAS